MGVPVASSAPGDCRLVAVSRTPKRVDYRLFRRALYAAVRVEAFELGERRRRPPSSVRAIPRLSPHCARAGRHWQDPGHGSPPARHRPCPTRVTRITAKVRNRIRLRSGNGAPLSVANGMASAAASETMPRTPVNASANGHCHGGAGSGAREAGPASAAHKSPDRSTRSARRSRRRSPPRPRLPARTPAARECRAIRVRA